MSAVPLRADGRDWRFLPAPEPRPSDRFQAIVSLQTLDELTGEPPSVPLSASTLTPGFRAAASAGGRVGLAAPPGRRFPGSWPGPAPKVHIRIESELHLPAEFEIDLGPQPAMPERFQPVAAPDLLLHRRPTRISGRAVSRLNGPAFPATVAVARYWPDFASIGGAGTAAIALSLWNGLYAARPAAASVRRRPLLLQADTKRLVRPAAEGALQILLSDRENLGAGRPLAIGPGDPERSEHIGIAAIDTALSADQPALVTLDFPLRRTHPAGTTVARTLFGGAGAGNFIVRDAAAGDVSLFLATMSGIVPGSTIVEVSGGGPVPEYHGFSLWQAATGADGSFRLPPIHRAAHVELDGPPGSSPLRFSLNAPGDALADILFD